LATRIRVLQITDSLHAAGREKVAVNLANLLPRSAYRSYLCTTRSNGVLQRELKKDVDILQLNRRVRLDLGALQRLIRFNKEHQIDILHAHGASLFIASLASCFSPYPKVVWHDHWGRFGIKDRPVWLYRCGTARAQGIIAVSKPLAEWSQHALHVPEKRVWYLPNFVPTPSKMPPVSELPGVKAQRIICVAHLRPQKDHLTLIRAMGRVVKWFPEAHLLLVGSEPDVDQASRIRNEIAELNLHNHVSVLGQRTDVSALLQSSQIGVLSSASEAFPLALLEYGMAGLAAVTTNVGQCAEVIDDRQTGLLVPPGQPEDLASALVSLLEHPPLAARLAKQLQERCVNTFGQDHIVGKVCQIYEEVLTPTNRVNGIRNLSIGGSSGNCLE